MGNDGVATGVHAIEATRVHLTMAWMVSGAILSRFERSAVPRLSRGHVDGVSSIRHRRDAIEATTSR